MSYHGSASVIASALTIARSSRFDAGDALTAIRNVGLVAVGRLAPTPRRRPVADTVR